MPIFRITSPDGAEYEVNAPDGATEQDAINFVRQQHRPAPAAPTEAPNGFKDAAVRMPVNALAALPEAVIDFPLTAGHWLGNQVNQRVLGRPADTEAATRPVAASKDAFLRSIGVNPKSTGALENMAQAGINALTGAGEANLLNKAAGAITPRFGDVAGVFAKNPALQTTGALGGTFAGEVAKSEDLPEWAQIAATVGGGVAAPTIASAAGGIGKGFGNAARTVLTDGGKDGIAARLFYKGLADPDKVVRRLEAFQAAQGTGPWRPGYGPGSILPGSTPITPEIASDVGLSAMQQAFRGNRLAQNLSLDQLKDARIAESDRAITDALNKANRRTGAGGEDALEKLNRIGSTSFNKFTTGKDLESVPVDVSGIHDEIDRLIRHYTGKPEIVQFLQGTKANIGDDPSFQHLWNARQTIDELIYGAKNKRDTPLASTLIKNYDSAGKSLRTSINDALKGADPEFSDFLRRSSYASKMSDAIKTGRELQDRMSLTGFHAAEGLDEVGATKIGAGKAAVNARKLTDLAGNDSAIAEKMTQRQRDTFDNVFREINRRDALNLGTGSGSHTADIINRGGLLTDDIINSVLGNNPAGGSWLHHGAEALLSPVHRLHITDGTEREILKRLGRAYTDPAFALEMAKKGATLQRGLMDLPGAASKSARSGLLGVLEGTML